MRKIARLNLDDVRMSEENFAEMLKAVTEENRERRAKKTKKSKNL